MQGWNVSIDIRGEVDLDQLMYDSEACDLDSDILFCQIGLLQVRKMMTAGTD